MLVMDFVPGRTLYDLRRGPDPGELAGIVEQAVRIHTVDAHPEFVFDPWAITNLVPLAGQLRDVLDTEQNRLVGQAIEEIAAVDREPLPVALSVLRRAGRGRSGWRSGRARTPARARWSR
nr:hypothetical protein GCM10020241_56220 [Streptoalloteichus tenebrarius]